MCQHTTFFFLRACSFCLACSLARDLCARARQIEGHSPLPLPLLLLLRSVALTDIAVRCPFALVVRRQRRGRRRLPLTHPRNTNNIRSSVATRLAAFACTPATGALSFCGLFFFGSFFARSRVRHTHRPFRNCPVFAAISAFDICFRFENKDRAFFRAQQFYKHFCCSIFLM